MKTPLLIAIKGLKLFLITIAVLHIIWFAVSLFIASGYDKLSLQPTDIPADYYEVKGGLHMHSTHSDGLRTPEEVYENLKQTDLDFFILTDYAIEDDFVLSKKLQDKRPIMIIGTEQNMGDGHLAGYGLTKPLERIYNNTEDALDAITDAGGITVAAHPFRRKNNWKQWDIEGLNGIEILSLSEVLLNTNRGKLALKVPQSFFNFHGTVNSLTNYPEKNIRQWDEMNTKAKTLGFFASDAHGPFLFGFPSYAQSVTTFTVHIPVTEIEYNDLSVGTINSKIKNGSFYNSVDSLAVSEYFKFNISSKAGSVYAMGDVLPFSEGLTLTVDLAAPAGSFIKIFRNGEELSQLSSNRFNLEILQSGVYRAEVWIDAQSSGYRRDMLWIVSNPIFVVEKDTSVKYNDSKE